MGGQNPSRREVLRILSLAGAASQFPGFSRWSFAGQHVQMASISPQASTAGTYLPQFFCAEEYATLERLTELIIPSDGSPGAREAGVSEFVDFMVGSDPSIQYRFRFGLAWMDSHARWLHGKRFLELSSDEQSAMLKPLAYKAQYRPREEDGRAFFRLVRKYTVMGFYTSRIGMEQLGYPGLQSVYQEMPGCPHVDDPQHRHLPPPQL